MDANKEINSENNGCNFVESNKSIENKSDEELVSSKPIKISDDDLPSDEIQNLEEKKEAVDSGDEYISDSSSDENEKEIEKEKESIKILPSSQVKEKSIVLNGMKVTMRKRPQRKQSHRAVLNSC